MISKGDKDRKKFCRPEPEAPNDKLARVLGSVLTFLQETRMLPNDQAGGYIEQLKVRAIQGH